jgi:polar amino acid transport system substrate-binding protein
MLRTVNRSGRRAGIALALPAVVLAACGGSSAPASSSASVSVSAQANIVSEVPTSIKGTPVQFAVDATYAPNEYVDPQTGEIKGWDIDLANAICKTMGLVCTPNNPPRYQISVSSWTPTAKREMSGIDFISYASVGEAWVAKAGGPKISTAADLCGHRVAVEATTTEESDAWGYMGMMVGGGAISGDTNHCTSAMTVDSYLTQTQADQALQSGRDDIGFLDLPVAQYEVKVSGGKLAAGSLTAGGQPCLVNPYGIALVQGAPLEQAVTDAVKYLISSGAYSQILANWNVQSVAIPASQVTLNNNTSVGQPCVPAY